MPGYVNLRDEKTYAKPSITLERLEELLEMTSTQLAIVLVSEDPKERRIAEKILTRELK